MKRNSHTIRSELTLKLKIPYYSVVKDQICYSFPRFDDGTAAKTFFKGSDFVPLGS
jgi:hypothetical protein